MRNHAAGIAVSLGLHGALLSLAWATGPIGVVTDRSIPVTLAMFQTQRTAESAVTEEMLHKTRPLSPRSERVTPPRPERVETVLSPPAPQPDSRAIPDDTSTPQPVAMTAQPPLSRPTLDIALLETRYLEGVRNAIEARKVYPRRANRLGQEGIVRITLVILRDGTIREARVTESSGHPELDEAALRAVARTARFDRFPKELARTEWEISVPIKYSLN
jgi:protein TonB